MKASCFSKIPIIFHPLSSLDFLSRFFVCLLFLVLVSCGDNDNDRTPASALEVIGLESDEEAVQSKRWRWSCEENRQAADCVYRYLINKKSSHTFSSNDKYTDTTEISTDEGLNGKYYLHVEAKSEATDRKSEVESVFAILDNTSPDDPSTFSFRVPQSSANSKIKVTVRQLKAGDLVRIFLEGGTNNNFIQNILPSFLSSATDPSDICVEENEVGSGTVASGKTEVTFDVNVRAGEHEYYATITDEANNTSDCERVFTYESVFVPEPPTPRACPSIKPEPHWKFVDDACRPSCGAMAGIAGYQNIGCTAGRDCSEYNHIRAGGSSCSSLVAGGHEDWRDFHIIDSGRRIDNDDVWDVIDTDNDVVCCVRRSSVSPRSPPAVTGLRNDSTPTSSKTWNWGCSKASDCLYRSTINIYSSHTFAEDIPYTAIKTATKSNADRRTKYYLHVQASYGSLESPVKSVSTVLIPLLNLEVTGLSSDSTAKIVKTWRWGCNNSPCTYRYVINQNRTHTFTSNNRYGSTTTTVKRITSSSENGTYYLHVQARDSDGRESEVETVSAVFRIEDEDVIVTGLEHDTVPKSSKTWRWSCNRSSCTYRYRINQSDKHTFSSRDSYSSTTTATKRITAASESGTYYIHVQARDSNGNVSEVQSVLVILEVSQTGSALEVTGLDFDPDAGNSKTWRWGCNRSSCTYRYAINQNSSHTFRSSDSYRSTTIATKRITTASESGTYYIHVQARDSNGNLSEVQSVFAILSISTTENVQVTGLSHDTSPKASKTWSWGCNKRSCTYRYAINQSSSHTFRSSDNYVSSTRATKTITSSNQNGTYYIHVQARDSNGNVSEVESVLVILQFLTSAVEVTGLSHDTNAGSSKTWNWGCNKSSCTYRYTINQSSSHTFSNSDSYRSTTRATKTITSSSQNGTYYIHVQARDSNGNVSEVESVLAVLRFSTSAVEVTGLANDATHTGNSKTWNWGCNKSSCTYRYVINQNRTHTFSNSVSYRSVTRASRAITSSNQNGTYYIHVQARDSNGNESAVESVFVILEFSATGDVQVTGLEHDTSPKSSKTWSWGCNRSSCTYRYTINQSSSHTFRSSDSYRSTTRATKTITSSNQNGTYYIHVQARDSNGNVSDVESVLAILEISATGAVQVTGLEHDTVPKASKTWRWGCNKSSCTYRYAINQRSSHNFGSSTYRSTTTATKTITSASENGVYFIHVQARDANGNASEVESVVAHLQISTSVTNVQVTGLSHDITPKRSKTWRWGCNQNSCTYRHFISRSQTHSFSNGDRYTSTTTATKNITSSSQDGTYYIHVQARDANGNVSEVESVLVILRYGSVPVGDLAITGIFDDSTPGSTKSWRWSCMNNSGACTYRHAINTDATHTFTASDAYNNTTTARKTVTANSQNGTYYLHVQARDASGNQSPVKSVVFYFSFQTILVRDAASSNPALTSEATPTTAKTWTWECRDATNANDGTGCTYRHAVNTSATHFFSSNDAYGSTVTQTVSTSAGYSAGTTHYLHVQAKDGTGRLSGVVTVHVTLTNKAILVKDPITEEVLSRASVKWTWQCDTDNSNAAIRATAPCQYRYTIVKEADSTCDGHTFNNDAAYNGTTTVTKTITSISDNGHYCLYVQTKDAQNNISVVKNIYQELEFELLMLKDPVAYKADAGSLPTKLQLHVDKTPTFTVLGFASDSRVRLYSSNECTDGSNDNNGDATLDTRLSNEVTVPSNNQADVTVNTLDLLRTYPVYVGVRTSSSDTSTDCWAATSSSDSTPIVVTDSNKDTVVPLFEYTLYSSIATENHVCYLSPGGEVKCWGRNGEGQLGKGDIISINTLPTSAINLGTGRTAKAIATGVSYTCAILDNDSVKCWGQNSDGRLGQGHTCKLGNGLGYYDNSGTPDCTGHASAVGKTVNTIPVINLGTGRTAKAIATGDGHACAILDNDSLKCWGNNSHGQLGIDASRSHLLAPQDDPVDLGCEGQTCSADDKFKAKAVTAGKNHTCVILLDENNTAPDYTGKVLCWGRNAKGQLGQNDTTDRGNSSSNPISRLVAINLGSGRTAKAISAGNHHTCALLDNNTTKCWGHNILGQLGQNDVADRGDQANEMSGLGTISLGNSVIKSIITGAISDHTCAVLGNDTMKCWGSNWRGQLGQGDKTEHSGDNTGRDNDGFETGTNIINNRNHGSGRGNDVPATTNRLAITVSSLRAINFGCHVVASRDGRTPPCSSSTNLKLKSPDSIAAGEDHTCAVLKTSQDSDQNKEFVKCWGSNTNGQLGQGDYSDRGGTSSTAPDKIPVLEFSF